MSRHCPPGLPVEPVLELPKALQGVDVEEGEIAWRTRRMGPPRAC